MTTKIRVTPTPLTIPIVAAGNVGQPGSQGPEGPPGPPGSPGPASTVPGPPGEQGIQGPPGTTGAIGPQGAQGPPGSAGATGPAGANGAQGPQGLPGAPGADSTVPGPAGAQGPQGPAGPAGADSTVPGPPGSTGPAGSTGAQGPKGDKGDTGTTGSTGPPGTAGATGAPGATGAAGAPGPNVVNGTTATPFTALLKGTGSLVAQAIPGTDYAIPTDLGLKVDKDSVVVAATRVLQSKLLAGDAQPTIQILGSGQINFGPGGAAGIDQSLVRTATSLQSSGRFESSMDIFARCFDPGKVGIGALVGGMPSLVLQDANLYRSAANVLQTDGRLIAVLLQASAGATRVEAGNIYDGTKACVVLGGDTNLYRSAAGTVKTDGDYAAAGNIIAKHTLASQVYMGGVGANAGIGFGSTADTNLYRSAVNELTTPGFLYANGGLGVNSGSLYLASNGPGGKILFGSASDTNLYRAAANTLKTDGGFYTGFLVSAGDVYAGSGASQILLQGGKVLFGNPADTNLYRFGAGILKTDGHLLLVGGVQLDKGDGTNRIYFGSANDTSLYRNGAGRIRTEGFEVLNDIVMVNSDASHRLYLGGGGDVYLYRSGAATMRTNGTIQAEAHLMLVADGGRLYLGAAADASLYRGAANLLRTDGGFRAGGHVVVDEGGGGSKLYFGAALDTSLYRGAANALQTDGIFNVFGTGGSAGFTALGINGNGVGNRTVQVGAPDSGGSGKRALTVPN